MKVNTQPHTAHTHHATPRTFESSNTSSGHLRAMDRTGGFCFWRTTTAALRLERIGALASGEGMQMKLMKMCTLSPPPPPISISLSPYESLSQLTAVSSSSLGNGK